MPNFTADLATNLVATPQAKNKTNKQAGRIRWFESTYTAPAASAPIIADTIEWGRLPVGTRIIASMSSLNVSAGTASCTINVGDSASAARHLGATGVTAAARTALVDPTNGVASFETTDASNTATDNTKLISTIAGAAIAVNQVLTLRIAYVQD